MFRAIAPALILSLAAHVVAAAGYWLWGGSAVGRETLPVVEVALVMDAPAAADVAESAPSMPDPAEPVPAPQAESPPPAVPHEPAPQLARAPETERPRTRPEPIPAAPPAPASAPVAAIDPGLIASVEQAYKSALQAEIARHRNYPRIARRLRQEGTVEVGFVVLADGRLTEIELLGSSGYQLLDSAAVQAVRDVRQFHPIPPELARERWDLSVPLNFRLL